MPREVVTVQIGDKVYAVAQVKAIGLSREDRVHDGREALDFALDHAPRFTMTVVPPKSWDDERKPIQREILPFMEHLDLLARAVANALGIPGEDPTALAEEIVTHWWRHEGNARVLRLCGADEQKAKAADLLHVLGFERFRTYGYAKARAMIAHAAAPETKPETTP